MSHNIDDLRSRLFAALDGLADEKKPMEVERAKAIADVARVIVDSAKAEIQLLHATGASRATTKFIPVDVVEEAPGARRISAGPGGCPSCGGQLRPETNGNGAVIDRCAKCGKSHTSALPRAVASAKGPAR